MNKKEDLKHYIQALQEQQKSQESKNGITLWGIGAGLIYILWQIISNISEIQKNPSSPAQLLELISIITTIVACTFSLSTGYSSRTQNTFDYRFSPSAQHITASTSLAILFLPAIISTLSFSYISIETADSRSFQKTSGYFFLTLLILISLAEHGMASKKNMPDVSSIITAEHGKFVKISVLLLFTAFAYIGANGIWKIADGIFTGKFSEPHIEVAFNLCLIPICLFIAKGIRDSERRSSSLNKLQRDIYIHNINTEEIEHRLKEEFIGFHFDERLQYEIDKIQRLIESFIETADQYEAIREKIKQINPELKYEINGHKSEYRTTISNAFNSYKKPFEDLKRWIDHALLSAKAQDTYVKTKLTEINSHLINTYKANSDTFNKILQDLELL